MASGEVSLVVNPHLIVGDRFTTYVEAAPYSLEIRATYPYGGGEVLPNDSEDGIFFFRLQLMPALIPPPPSPSPQMSVTS